MLKLKLNYSTKNMLTMAFMVIFSSTGLSLILFETQNAYSDGLFMEHLPPATVGDRQASLFTRIFPPVLTTETQDNPFLQLRLYDANTNETIQHVSYFVTATKDGELLMRELFHSHEGEITIKVNPQEGPTTVFGTFEPFLGGWMSEGGQVAVTGPLLLDGGLYHFQIEIFSIDHDRNIFTPEDAPKFDSYLSVGDITPVNINYNNSQYNATLISYYDQIQNFTFDESQSSLKWTMPFDWNLSRIQEQNILVHEEIRIPRELSLFNTTRFNATVNGAPLTGRGLAVDPFASPDDITVHFMINKNDLIKLAQVNQDKPNVMTFTLSPQDAMIETTTDLVSDLGGIHVKTNWTISSPGTPSTVNFNFIDAFTDEPFQGDVSYNIRILNNDDNSEIATKENIIAEGGKDSQQFTFPSKGIYQVELLIDGVTPEGQLQDTTRSGIARGYVVVN